MPAGYNNIGGNLCVGRVGHTVRLVWSTWDNTREITMTPETAIRLREWLVRIEDSTAAKPSK